eukprot:3251667-Pyramimonas_sp.AAC.1
MAGSKQREPESAPAKLDEAGNPISTPLQLFTPLMRRGELVVSPLPTLHRHKSIFDATAQ